MGRIMAMDALETKIEKAQLQVSKAKKQYDEALAKLSDLLDKRDPEYMRELANELIEIINFMRSKNRI